MGVGKRDIISDKTSSGNKRHRLRHEGGSRNEESLFAGSVPWSIHQEVCPSTRSEAEPGARSAISKLISARDLTWERGRFRSPARGED